MTLKTLLILFVLESPELTGSVAELDVSVVPLPVFLVSTDARPVLDSIA
jgi:hypothetical protein